MKNTQLQKDINLIKERNKRVESEKAWETSWARKTIIAIMTYVTIVLFFLVANLPKPFINSIVPTAGFVLSTLSLPFFKRIWLRKNNHHK
ncbi:MAG: hypothetical protein ACP5N3_04045 [Candidatus Nanoarchaeia archaeon]